MDKYTAVELAQAGIKANNKRLVDAVLKIKPAKKQ